MSCCNNASVSTDNGKGQGNISMLVETGVVPA